MLLFASDIKLTLCSQTPVFRPGGNKKGGPPPNVPDHEPPTGYICYRCGEKGHWIQVCPTNDDPTFDNKPRVKRTTGIPRSFLKTVDKPVALSNDGTTDDTKAPSGIMVNAEGEFVIAEPDKASWEQFQAKTKFSAAAQKAAASGDKELQDRGLECSIDKRMFIDPMKTPCCEKTYCNDCITNALIESDFTCPGCGTDEVLIDNLKPDEEMSAKIKAYLDEKDAAKKEKESSKSPSVKAEEPKAEEYGTAESVSVPVKEKTLSPSPLLPSAAAVKSSKSPSPESKPEIQAVNGPPTAPKKRSADELLENPKIPKGPKAMQQQEAEKQAQFQQQAMMNSMNAMTGFPNMPVGFDMSQQFGNNGFGMGMGGFNTMNGYGMGMAGSMTMPPMMGMGTSMMNPMMGMNGFPMNGGFPNMNGMGMGGPGMYGNGMGYGGSMNVMGMGLNGSNSGVSNSNGGNVGVFPNQQKTVFAAPLLNEEDNAYFRKPVNPHRHQGRQRRARPSDYREL
jgi:protein MPE1